MSLGIWKKLAALLSVICISVILNGCGPAAETPASGKSPVATAPESNTDESTGKKAAAPESEESGTEEEAGSVN